ncbi:Uncharacterised protein [Vibrio cholerae]|nr:Uncharacterised protein [Vibrio cholerae]
MHHVHESYDWNRQVNRAYPPYRATTLRHSDPKSSESRFS